MSDKPRAKAYVLMEVTAGNLPKIIEQIKSIEGVVSCDVVTGQYDLIAVLEADDVNEIGRISYTQLQSIEGITRTITCNVVRID